MSKEKVIDLSGYNPPKSNEKIDFSKVKNDGINYIILKAINKSNAKDKRFEEHMAGCISAGIQLLATYHYSYAKSAQTAKENAKVWMAAVDDRCKKFALDWEDEDTLPKDRQAVEIINAYADAIIGAGYEFFVYTGWAWYKSYLKKYKDLLPYDFWIARYYARYKKFTTNDKIDESYMPAISHNLIGWQYTSSGSISGINGAVDMNISYDGLTAYNTMSIETLIKQNPYIEPKQNVRLGTMGNDANWVLWYLYLFGFVLDKNGVPDANKINGIITAENVEMIKKSQMILGTTPDGIVGKITRGLYKKVC